MLYGVNIERRICSFNNRSSLPLGSLNKGSADHRTKPQPSVFRVQKVQPRERKQMGTDRRSNSSHTLRLGHSSRAFCGVQGWNKAHVLWKRGWALGSRELNLVPRP
uniref:Uncharacterized protein n=1 Tax=Mus musculus TaxID=10090 RepID=Q3URX4_MOUSE|nr:unnamed protein product [Mus musculus]